MPGGMQEDPFARDFGFNLPRGKWESRNFEDIGKPIFEPKNSFVEYTGYG